jgi:hypothetical protein
VLYPGLLVQMITTKRPSDDMIEVAIVSMEQALVADGADVPAGSSEFEQRPMRCCRRGGRRRSHSADLDRTDRPTPPRS